ncbi:MAG: ribosomal protein S18-alanine N-acetyltransferase [Thermoplasmata archaeon]|nr:ribosomal protein S18-alanine N-acetyltransferase [Thermoplasmata archaeon]
MEDLPDVIKIENLSFKYTYPSSIFHDYLSKLFFVADENKKIVGYAIGDKHRHLIVSIAVHPEYRRNGIGTMLINEILKNMEDYAVLQVRKSNIDAIKFYKKNGFNEKNIIKYYYIDGEDAILMSKKIG